VDAGNRDEKYPKAQAGSAGELRDAVIQRRGMGDEQASPEQIAILRRMTPERRLALAEGLFWTAREMKAAWLRGLHPDWSEEDVAREVTRIFSHART
jgi:hypothetical protein